MQASSRREELEEYDELTATLGGFRVRDWWGKGRRLSFEYLLYDYRMLMITKRISNLQESEANYSNLMKCLSASYRGGGYNANVLCPSRSTWIIKPVV